MIILPKAGFKDAFGSFSILSKSGLHIAFREVYLNQNICTVFAENDGRYSVWM